MVVLRHQKIVALLQRMETASRERSDASTWTLSDPLESRP